MGGFFDTINPGGGGGGGPVAPAYLTDLAIAAGAKHVWGGAPDPREDQAGALDLSGGGGSVFGPPPPAGLDVLVINAVGSATDGPRVAGATLHKGADRSWMVACLIPTPSTGLQAMLQLGAYNDTNALGQLTASNSTNDIRWWDRTYFGTKYISLFGHAGNAGKWAVIFGAWDESTLTHTLYWSVDGGAEDTGSVVGVAEGSSTCTVYLGGDGSTIYTVPVPYAWSACAVADGLALADAGFRASVYSALGWPDAA